jgi:hypothetical protein
VVDSASNRKIYQEYFLGIKAANRADNLTNYMCRLSGNLGASTSLKSLDLFRPAVGLPYLYLFCKTKRCQYTFLYTKLQFSVSVKYQSFLFSKSSFYFYLPGLTYVKRHPSLQEGQFQDHSV